MSLFQKHLSAQAKLQKRAEDESKDEEDQFEKEAETDDEDEDGQDKEATVIVAEDESADEEDKDVDEVKDAVEAEVEDVVDEVKEALLKSKARPAVINAVLSALDYNGILVANPLKGKTKSVKYTEAELKFIQRTVNAATEAVEEVLRAAAKTLKNRKCTKKQAALLDKKLEADGYLRSTVASPTKVGGTERSAQAKKTRKNVLGLKK